MPDTPAVDPVRSSLFNDLGPFQGVVGEESLRDFDFQRDNLMEKMGPEGDTKTIWDPDNPDEVDNARRSFEDLVDKGYRAFRVSGPRGDQGEMMTEFDPDAGRMILVPPVQGG